jgi:hypothetical protein
VKKPRAKPEVAGARITEVSVRRLRNLGDFENDAVEFKAQLNKGAKGMKVAHDLENMARAHLGHPSIEQEQAQAVLAASQELAKRVQALHQRIVKVADNVAGHLRNSRMAADRNDDKNWRSFIGNAISGRSAAMRDIDIFRGAMAEWHAEEARAEVQRARAFLGQPQPALPKEPPIPEIPPELVPEGWDRSHH